MVDERSDEEVLGEAGHPRGSGETPIEPWVLVALSLVGAAVLAAITRF